MHPYMVILDPFRVNFVLKGLGTGAHSERFGRRWFAQALRAPPGVMADKSFETTATWAKPYIGL